MVGYNQYNQYYITVSLNFTELKLFSIHLKWILNSLYFSLLFNFLLEIEVNLFCFLVIRSNSRVTHHSHLIKKTAVAVGKVNVFYVSQINVMIWENTLKCNNLCSYSWYTLDGDSFSLIYLSSCLRSWYCSFTTFFVKILISYLGSIKLLRGKINNCNMCHYVSIIR